MLTKRIIPCLDVTEGRVVKGTSFTNLQDAGDPVELAAYYYEQGADELVFLDIGATPGERNTMVDVVINVSKKVFIPLTVGGGLRDIKDIRNILEAGADKVSINTAAVLNPELIREGAKRFGEAAIGTNSGIRKFTRNMLFDEKIGGTIHMAIGACYPETGGRNESSVHWDMLADMKNGGEIFADEECIYRNGKFII